jgi:predicted DNA-binding transcriptional regulator AlpA
MSQKRYIQISELATTKNSSGLLPISPTTCWRLVKRGLLPAPFKLGPGTTVWDLNEIEEAIAAFKSKRSTKRGHSL